MVSIGLKRNQYSPLCPKHEEPEYPDKHCCTIQSYKNSSKKNRYLFFIFHHFHAKRTQLGRVLLFAYFEIKVTTSERGLRGGVTPSVAGTPSGVMVTK